MCASMTGLKVRESKDLSADFFWNYSEYESKKKIDRKRRIGGGINSYLESTEEKYLLLKNFLNFFLK